MDLFNICKNDRLKENLKLRSLLQVLVRWGKVKLWNFGKLWNSNILLFIKRDQIYKKLLIRDLKSFKIRKIHLFTFDVRFYGRRHLQCPQKLTQWQEKSANKVCLENNFDFVIRKVTQKVIHNHWTFSKLSKNNSRTIIQGGKS